jgi:hypothetical protein
VAAVAHEVKPGFHKNISTPLRSNENRLTLLLMFRYRGRSLSAADILYIRELIAAHPGESRRALSRVLCEAWQWRQPNGALRDMVCRSMLLMLERAGQIALPPVSYVRHNPLARSARPAPVLIDTMSIEDRLHNLGQSGLNKCGARLKSRCLTV